MSSVFGHIAAWAARHARVVLVVSALLAVVAGVGATQLPTDAETSTLVNTDAPSYQATQHVREKFGEEPVVILAEGDLQQLVLTANLGRLLRLEGCLSGKVPAGAKPIPGPCAQLARQNPVKSVVGPATFLNGAVIQIDRQLRRLAARVPPERLREFLLAVAARYGITSAPSLSNPDFLAAVVFDLRRARGTPKSRLAYLFPNNHTAQIIVRLRPGLSESERHKALETIRAAVYDDTPRQLCKFKGKPEPCFELRGGRYVVSGVPVVIDGVTRALRDALLVLLIAAVVVMALTLVAVFRSRFRLLPLGVALASAGLTFGLLGLLGGSLTMASIAVLPILIGLAVDYAIQLQARYDEAVEAGARGADAARLAATRGGPTIATACLATAAGLLALQLSPTPMVRDFGLLLVIGIGIAFLLAMTAGFAALSLRPEAGAPDAPPRAGFFASWFASLAKRVGRKTGRRTHPGHPTLPPLTQRTIAVAQAHPQRVLAIGLALAMIGWGAGTQVGTVSDIRELAPQDLRAVKDLNELQDATGVSGEIDVSVRAPDLTDPSTLRWMAAFKQRVLLAGGFSGANPSCRDAEVCPGPALSDFVVGGSGPLRRRDIRATLAELPIDDLEKVVEVDRSTGLPREGGTTLLGFGVRAQSLDDQQALIERIEAEIGEPGSPGGPPPGVEVQLAGVPVIAAAAATELAADRYLLTLAGLVGVALALLAVYRSLRRAFLPLVPILLATGWGLLILWAGGVQLNPMSVALGALTIAIATEFSVILSARFYEERSQGSSFGQALHRAYGRTGVAVFASAVTATAGFAVLLVSDVRMLRDFGFVTVIDLVVALVGVMVALPAALAWLEEDA
ncbi:MAG TPA: MMPL family transporter [Solirubrobacterales bacterium]|jgi:hydrophobe/amphiphile efflux-3 (HAE3) family protein